MTLPETGKVMIEIVRGSAFSTGRTYTLLTGGNISDATVFALPEGDRGSLVVESGDLYYKPPYFVILVR
jgi:hypothetical protein